MLYYRIKLYNNYINYYTYHVVQGIEELRDKISHYKNCLAYQLITTTSYYTYQEAVRLSDEDPK